jgi:hypothetical protein
MAGGMDRRRSARPSLHERIHGAPPATAAPEPTASGEVSGRGVRHCWVTDNHGRQPALLLEWRQVAAGWQGRVVRPVLAGDAWVVVEEWLPAKLLEPSDAH